MSDSANTLTPAKPVDLVRASLERMKPQLAMALPRHLTADRLVRVAMTAVQTTPKLLECDRTSFFSAIMTCAQLGLEPDGVLGQAYLVPFAGKVQFIPGYKGLITLARNSGDVISIAAHEIRDNDTFVFDFASGDPPKHTFDIRKERGAVIAFYAIARFKDGSFHWDMMTRDEVDRIRDNSSGYIAAKKSKWDSPWDGHYVEMGKKTMVRRIAKYLPLSVQKAAALADSYDTGRHVTLDNHGDIVIDPERIRDDGPALERPATQLERFEEQHDPVTGEIEEPADVVVAHAEPASSVEAPETDLLGSAVSSLNVPIVRSPNATDLDYFHRQIMALIGEQPHNFQRIAQIKLGNKDGLDKLKAGATALYDEVMEALSRKRNAAA